MVRDACDVYCGTVGEVCREGLLRWWQEVVFEFAHSGGRSAQRLVYSAFRPLSTCLFREKMSFLCVVLNQVGM